MAPTWCRPELEVRRSGGSGSSCSLRGLCGWWEGPARAERLLLRLHPYLGGPEEAGRMPGDLGDAGLRRGLPGGRQPWREDGRGWLGAAPAQALPVPHRLLPLPLSHWRWDESFLQGLGLGSPFQGLSFYLEGPG